MWVGAYATPAASSRARRDTSEAASLLGIGELGTDFSLKQGEKITIKVNIDGAKKGAGAGLAAFDGLSLAAPARAPAPAPAPAPAAPATSWESFS